MNRNLKLRIISNYDSQADFSKAIGRAQSLVSRVVRGRKTLTMDEKRRWAVLLHCKSEDIFQNGEDQ